MTKDEFVRQWLDEMTGRLLAAFTVEREHAGMLGDDHNACKRRSVQ